MWQGGKFAPRIISHHANVVFLWAAPKPPCHGLKEPKYAMDKRVNPWKLKSLCESESFLF